jgi:protease I
MKRVVIITGPDFQDEEYIYPYYRLQEAGYHVDVATKDKAVMNGKYGIPAKPTIDVKDLNSDNYDAVVLPGGTEAPDRVRQIKEVLKFVKEMHDKGKVVAAICHGPWILISAQVVRGKRATCYVGMADDLKNAGALYSDEPVVIDGNLITSPHYRNNGDLMKAVIQKLDNNASSPVNQIDYRKLIVNKPWGYEYLMYQNEDVAIWCLHIQHGAATSLHCHPRKKTGLILLSGEAELSFLNDSHPIKPLTKSMIRPGLFHSTTALSKDGAVVIESETPNDKSDLVRLLDKYGREGKPYEGRSEMRPIDASCVQIFPENGKYPSAQKVAGCSISVEKFTDQSGFLNRKPGEVIVTLEGGLVSRHGIPVLAPGDVIWSQNLDRLNEICSAPKGATILVVRQ